MELNLQPLATICCVTGESFAEGDRVASHLVRSTESTEIVRFDVAEDHQDEFTPAGTVACRWVQAFKPRNPGENPERELKLTAESLFLTLASPDAELSDENVRLVQVLALMLERKRVLRPKGKSADRKRLIYEHAKSKELYEITAGELSPEFFLSIQDQLAALVGGGKPKEEPVAAPESGPNTDTQSPKNTDNTVSSS